MKNKEENNIIRKVPLTDEGLISVTPPSYSFATTNSNYYNASPTYNNADKFCTPEYKTPKYRIGSIVTFKNADGSWEMGKILSAKLEGAFWQYEIKATTIHHPSESNIKEVIFINFQAVTNDPTDL